MTDQPSTKPPASDRSLLALITGLTMGVFLGFGLTTLIVHPTPALKYVRATTPDDPKASFFTLSWPLTGSLLEQEGKTNTTLRVSLINHDTRRLSYVLLDCNALDNARHRIDERWSTFSDVNPNEELLPTLAFANATEPAAFSCTATAIH